MYDNKTIRGRMLGCLYGQAIGDALGFGAEAMSKDEVSENYPTGLSKYSQIIQDERRSGWPIGWWTDDTEMMLLILDAFVEGFGRIDKNNLASKFLEWYDAMGYKSCGILTRKTLNFAPPLYKKNPVQVAELVWKLKGCNNAPNGGLMRTSIIGLFKENVEEWAEYICKMTHFDSRCVASCVVASAIIHTLVWKDKKLTVDEVTSIGIKYDKRITEWIILAFESKEIAQLDLDEPQSDAYTFRTLSAALWCYWHAKSFEDGLLAVVNEGGDADTNAAIACAILGAKFGYDSIPQYYIENLFKKEEYHNKVNKFISLALNEKE